VTMQLQLRAALLSLLLAAQLQPQSGSSTIAGSIKDVTGAVITGAQVKVVNEESGVAFTTVTNQTGLYRLSSLLPGTYRVEVEAEGN